MKAVVSVLLAGLALHMLFQLPAAEAPNPFTAGTNLFRGAVLSTLQRADWIQAFRIDPFIGRSPENRKKFGGYPILKESTLTNSVFARSVADTLLGERIYSQAGLTKCSFAPGVGYRIGSGTNIVEALVCLDCSQISISSTSGTNGYYVHFNTSRDRHIALAKQAFPGDIALDGIKPSSPFE
jgi:hypothetical protein